MDNHNAANAAMWLGGTTPPPSQREGDLRTTLSFNRGGYRENGNRDVRIYIPNVSCI